MVDTVLLAYNYYLTNYFLYHYCTPQTKKSKKTTLLPRREKKGSIKYMAPITIPKELIKEKELALIPRKEYEALLQLRKIMEFTPTSAQKKL